MHLILTQIPTVLAVKVSLCFHFQQFPLLIQPKPVRSLQVSSLKNHLLPVKLKMMKQLLQRGAGPMDWTAHKTVLREPVQRELNQISQRGLKIILSRAQALLAGYC